jgi:ABC-type branched-subunit amino acid transport system ATPase component
LFPEIAVTIAAAAAVLLLDQPTAMMNRLWNETRTAPDR